MAGRARSDGQNRSTAEPDAWASNRQAVPAFGPPTFEDLLATLGLHPFEKPMGTLSAEITWLTIGDRHGFAPLKATRPIVFF